jgi:23S rRNA (cytidine2498-2'-O)-methyltransferase
MNRISNSSPNQNADTSTQAGFAWLGYCRPGFEADLALELQEHGSRVGVSDGVVASEFADAGFVIVPMSIRAANAKTPRLLKVAEFTFARQWVLAHGAPIALTSNDRVNPCFDAAQLLLDALGVDAVADCWVEYPDTNDGKALSRGAKAIEPRLAQMMDDAGRINRSATLRLHVFLTPGKHAWVGVVDIASGSNDPLGIPRLRMPHEAPSRSTLKLAEAIQFFLRDDADKLLAPDMRAVDLGAAPGGWTWQLISRGVRVTAVDNGPLKGDLVDNAMVKHLREDGFRYAPKVPVDWMVCDMVEQPSRIAKLVAEWLVRGWARYIIFNLKLPMKKRNAELARCRQIISDAADAAGKPLALHFKQLYHDREEVTAFATFPSRRALSAAGIAVPKAEPSREAQARSRAREADAAEQKRSPTERRAAALTDALKKAHVTPRSTTRSSPPAVTRKATTRQTAAGKPGQRRQARKK